MIGIFFSLIISIQDISPERLQHEVQGRLCQVPTFKLIQAEAAKRGLKISLAGGAAAAWAAYVLWDLRRESGDTRYGANYFDYNIHTVLRQGQDLDLVVTTNDGGIEDLDSIRELERYLVHTLHPLAIDIHTEEIQYTTIDGKTRSPFTRNNTEHAKQNSDSISTGIIPLDPSHPIEDLRSDPRKIPRFIETLLQGELIYDRLASHKSTSRFAEGLNPELISAIKALINASRFGLTINPKSQMDLRSIIDKHDGLNNHYVSRWINSNLIKLFSQSFDLDRTYQLLDSLQLRHKIPALTSDKRVRHYANRTPLPSSQDRRLRPQVKLNKPGRTAQELDIRYLAHETTDVEIFRNIISSPTGRPQFLISDGSNSTNAMYGPGVYTKSGFSGETAHEMSGGYHVTMELDPNAIEGIDFVVAINGFKQIIILLNNEKVRVSPIRNSIQPKDLIETAVQALKTGRLDYLLWASEVFKGMPLSDELRGQWKAAIESSLNRGRLLPVLIGLLFTDNNELKSWAHTLVTEWLKHNPNAELQVQKLKKKIILQSKYRLLAEFGPVLLFPLVAGSSGVFMSTGNKSIALLYMGSFIGLLGWIAWDMYNDRLPQALTWVRPLMLAQANRVEGKSRLYRYAAGFIDHNRDKLAGSPAILKSCIQKVKTLRRLR